MDTGAISVFEIASERPRGGVSRWPRWHAGAETSDGRGPKLLSDFQREHVWRFRDESAERRNAFGGARGNGGFFQLRCERRRVWTEHDHDHVCAGACDRQGLEAWG